MKNQPIIGLEVHVELATKSKMFCGCPADHFGVEPNTHTCPVCLGLPGALPVPNKKAIEWTIKLAMALECKINLESHFDRKNYFYPDLPKGYQITQYEKPFGENGSLVIASHEVVKQSSNAQGQIASSQAPRNDKIIRIRRVHLEEDVGKLQHQNGETLIDFNRSGVPLVEIVTEPDFRNLEEVDIYLKKLQRIIRYLGISNADMEKGSMRLEPSISIMPISNNSNIQFPMPNDQLPKYRVELKNINSFKFVKKALEYEIERQKTEPHVMQTRGWDENKGITFPQREKEEAHDYRYFPEPDIPPIRMSNEQLAIIQSMIPELPDKKLSRFIKQYNISEYQANILTESIKIADDFEEKVKNDSDFTAVDVANAVINKRPLVVKSTEPVDGAIIKRVLSENSQAVLDYKNGKTQILGFLIGQIAKLLPNVDRGFVKNKLEEELKK